jgi:hypothetical protein
MPRRPPPPPRKKKDKDKSQHFTFRLHPDNPAEADAMEILNRLECQGHSRREIMCAALLSLEGKELPASPGREEVQAMLYELRQALEGRREYSGDPAPSAPAPKVKRSLLNFVANSTERFTDE